MLSNNDLRYEIDRQVFHKNYALDQFVLPTNKNSKCLNKKITCDSRNNKFHASISNGFNSIRLSGLNIDEEAIN